MYLKLGQINIWPSRELVDKSMPQDFKDKYSRTSIIRTRWDHIEGPENRKYEY